MNAVQTGEKRDLVLNPLEQAFQQDLTRGTIKTYVGPCVVNQTAQDRAVRYNHAERTYRTCNLDEAVFKVPIASEGDYIVLDNPSVKPNERPEEATCKVAPALNVGRKVNIPGPCTVPLWPGQDAQVIKGHNLRSNQYLVVRIYNEEEARANWGKAVVKKATPEAKPEQPKGEQPEATASAPVVGAEPEGLNLAIGQLLIIKGTEVSFYIPPTGVEVLKDAENNYVRDALTLERLTYCVLVDEDGNKRYEKGPQVVFPEPTETFLLDKDNNRKFKAIELGQGIQGIHVKVIAPYREGEHEYHEGDELFITGRETAIYYPRPEHSIIMYGDQKKHYATAIPAGEGRYVMNRNNGEIRTEKGPKMLLPDPRTEVTVRRILSDRQCDLWYPGNGEAKAYNQGLRVVAQESPSARSGFVSEGDVKKKQLKDYAERAQRAGHMNVGTEMLEQLAAGAAGPEVYGAPIQQPGQALLADVFSRGTGYTPPRTITLDTKYEGVPAISVWTGYAVMVVNKRGGRRVEQGPTTVLLDYDESLEVLELSTGKPKNTDKLEKTVYLRVMNNKVSDIVQVETSDHVPVQIKLAYRVSFEGEPNKWFETENYVKLLCDHARSVLKGKVQRLKIEDFYKSSTDTVRDIILGRPAAEGGERPGMVFDENGMHVTDVEVLGIQIDNEQIRNMLTKAQYEVVSGNIQITQLEKALEVTKRKEEIAREQADAEAETVKRKHELAIGGVAQELALILARIKADLDTAEKRKGAAAEQEGVKDVGHQAELARQKASADQSQAIEEAKAKLRISELVAEADATVKRFQAAQEGFSEALLALGNQETLAKVAEAMSVQNLLGGRDFAAVVGKLFNGSPVQAIIEKVMDRAAPNQDGAAGGKRQSIPQARNS